MTVSKAALVVRIDNHERLKDIFGAAAVDRALADLGAEIPVTVDRLLAQHEQLDRCTNLNRGRWLASFRILAGGLPRDPGETATAIEAAARKLIRDGLAGVFGNASAMQVRCTTSVVPLPDDHSGKVDEITPEWLDQQLSGVAGTPLFTPSMPEAAFREIVQSQAVRTVLQPIVSLGNRSLIGWEALSRGPLGSELERPDHLFEAAHAFGQTVELELLCARLALERTAGLLPPNRRLTVNLGPEALALAASELPLAGRENIVLELTEHMPLDTAEGLVGAVEGLRARGVELALDDAGCGFADLETTRILRPEVVKLCITVIRNSDKGAPYLPAIQETTRAIQALGSRVLAEGVETEEQHRAVLGCGVEYGQGWLYGKPQPVEVSVA